MHDSYLLIDDLVGKHETGVTIDKQLTRDMPYNNTFHNAVSFELNPNRVVYYRRVFSLLNWLAEIGGLIGVSKSVCLFIVATLHYRGVY